MVRLYTLVIATAVANVAHAVDYLITFGDSYSQTGFDVASTKPSSANPLGNPSYPGYTSSGGANWIGYLVKEYNATSIYSYNFASGGATVNASLVTPYKSTVLSLIDQVAQFSNSIANHPSYAPWTSDNSLFGIWMGVNDVGNSFSLDNINELLGKILEDYFEQVEILFKAGARNFVFLGVPPIDQTPVQLAQSKEVRAKEAAVISQFNKLVASHSEKFSASHKGVRAVVVDTQAPFYEAISNPTKYGSKDASCYNSDGKTCLWFNDYHPGVAIQKLVAEAVARTWKGSLFKVSKLHRFSNSDRWHYRY